MRLRLFLAASGMLLSLGLSLLRAVPAIYNILDVGLSHVHYILLPLLSHVAILAVLVVLWLGKPVRRLAMAAAFCMGLQLVMNILARPNSQVALLRWLLVDLLSDFAWIVMLVLLARESKPLENRETSYAAGLLAIATVIGTLSYGYVVSGNWRLAVVELSWLLPDGESWKAAGAAIAASIALLNGAALTYFLVGVFHGSRSALPSQSDLNHF
jgi:hypothetical protein